LENKSQYFRLNSQCFLYYIISMKLVYLNQYQYQ
jgi:hypothetical protein